MQLTAFRDTLRRFGSTDTECAQNLGIPLRTFKDYKAGRLPRAIFRLHPELLRALADDAERVPEPTACSEIGS